MSSCIPSSKECIALKPVDSILSLELTVCDSQGDSLEASVSNSFVDDGDFHIVNPDAVKW